MAATVWKRTANRYFVQDSRRWLGLQPDRVYQWGLTNEQVSTCPFIDNEDGSFDSLNSHSKESYEFVEMDSFDSCNGFKQLNGFSLDSKVHPWWQMTKKDDLIEKCQNAISRVEIQHLTSKSISPPISDIDLSKFKILEALRHSQTRAREAENAAKEAHAEKEHVINLLFNQASQLLVYKQWIHLLQLQNLYYQIKNNTSNSISCIVVPSKTGKPCKNPKKITPTAQGRPRTRVVVQPYGNCVGKYAVVFAVGLGLVGAGLLLGWTIGWMLIQ